MDIQVEKLSVIQRLRQINDISLIKAINEILGFALKQKNKKDISDTLINVKKNSMEKDKVQKRLKELIKEGYITWGGGETYRT